VSDCDPIKVLHNVGECVRTPSQDVIPAGCLVGSAPLRQRHQHGHCFSMSRYKKNKKLVCPIVVCILWLILPCNIPWRAIFNPFPASLLQILIRLCFHRWILERHNYKSGIISSSGWRIRSFAEIVVLKMYFYGRDNSLNHTGWCHEVGWELVGLLTPSGE